MFISAVYVRFFRSFNYDYLRKTHDTFRPYPWDVLAGDLKYPFVKVDLEKSVTTVVGANESGKSQMLSAIGCALTGRGIRLGDFCRYSQFFAVDDSMAPPDFGLELSDLDSEERAAVSKTLKPKSPAVGDRFCLFRFGGQAPVIYLPDQEDWQQVEVKSPEVLNALLPKAFEIDSKVALPDSVPLRYLAEGKHSFSTAPRKLRQGFLRQVVSNASEWFGPRPEAIPVLHSEITRKRITASSIVADQGSGQVDLAPEGAGDRSDHVDSADQHSRGQQPSDRRGRQRQQNQPQRAASLSRSVASFP